MAVRSTSVGGLIIVDARGCGHDDPQVHPLVSKPGRPGCRRDCEGARVGLPEDKRSGGESNGPGANHQIAPRLESSAKLMIDSMDFLNFVIALHKEFKTEIPEKDYPKLRRWTAAWRI